jgi:hypothetical protein
MDREHLKRANRALLDAIEVPPDSGLEPRIDSLAARLWAAGNRSDAGPDPGEICRLERKLARLETQARGERAEYVAAARESVRARQASLDASF